MANAPPVVSPVSPPPFSLGMEGWTDSPPSRSPSRSPTPLTRKRQRKAKGKRGAATPSPKRKRRNLSLPKTPSSHRWVFLDECAAGALEKKYVLKNTESSTKWALSNFMEWKKSRNARFNGEPEKQVPESLLSSTDDKILSKWLSLYAAETRKRDGTQYPSKTVYLLLSGILRHMRTINPLCPNFLDTSNLSFSSFHTALDNIFRDLRLKGVGSGSKVTEAFTKDEEDLLWSSGALSTETPKGLLRAVFFLNGKNFCLREGEEHRQLKISQLQKVADPPRYIYTENASKNRGGGLVQLRVRNKVVPIDAVAEVGIRCHVYILDLYLQNLPPNAFKHDNFYLKPCSQIPKDPTAPWFTCNPVGKNTLAKMVKEMCDDANVKLTIVLELRVLLLCIRPGYLKKPFKRERGTCRSLAFVITKGQTLTNNRRLQRFWLRQREALLKSTTLRVRMSRRFHRIHRKTTPLLTAK